MRVFRLLAGICFSFSMDPLPRTLNGSVSEVTPVKLATGPTFPVSLPQAFEHELSPRRELLLRRNEHSVKWTVQVYLFYYLIMNLYHVSRFFIMNTFYSFFIIYMNESNMCLKTLSMNFMCHVSMHIVHKIQSHKYFWLCVDWRWWIPAFCKIIFYRGSPQLKIVAVMSFGAVISAVKQHLSSGVYSRVWLKRFSLLIVQKSPYIRSCDEKCRR